MLESQLQFHPRFVENGPIPCTHEAEKANARHDEGDEQEHEARAVLPFRNQEIDGGQRQNPQGGFDKQVSEIGFEHHEGLAVVGMVWQFGNVGIWGNADVSLPRDPPPSIRRPLLTRPKSAPPGHKLRPDHDDHQEKTENSE